MQRGNLLWKVSEEKHFGAWWCSVKSNGLFPCCLLSSTLLHWDLIHVFWFTEEQTSYFNQAPLFQCPLFPSQKTLTTKTVIIFMTERPQYMMGERSIWKMAHSDPQSAKSLWDGRPHQEKATTNFKRLRTAACDGRCECRMLGSGDSSSCHFLLDWCCKSGC